MNRSARVVLSLLAVSIGLGPKGVATSSKTTNNHLLYSNF